MHIDSYALGEFYRLRQAVFASLDICYKQGDAGKSYEGSFAIYFPSYHANVWTITCDCSLLGPHRHYQWDGTSLMEAVKKAETDIKSWGVCV